MTGLEPVVVGYFVRWAMQKAQKVGERLDSKVDLALAALADRVVRKLGGDAALQQLERESAEGKPKPRTTKRVEWAIEEAVERDPSFAADLRAMTAELQRLAPQANEPSSVVIHAIIGGNAQVPIAGRDQTNFFGSSGALG